MRSPGAPLALRRTEDGYKGDPSVNIGETALRIRFEPDCGPCERLPELGATAQIIIRDAYLPVELTASGLMIESTANPLNSSRANLSWGLRQVLQAVFAKEDFRSGQLDSLIEILSGRDCAVLLPTGAGKSLIYQLAGTCLAGPVLVIDPLISLIEDQAQGLRNHGFDRLAEISRFTSMRGLTAQTIKRSCRRQIAICIRCAGAIAEPGLSPVPFELCRTQIPRSLWR